MVSREKIMEILTTKNSGGLGIDFGGTGTTGVNAVVYNGVKKLLNIISSTKVVEVMGQMAEIEAEVLDHLGGDVVVLWRQSPCLGLLVTDYVQGRLTNGQQCICPVDFLPIDDQDGNSVYCKPGGGRDTVHPYLTDMGSEYDKGVPVAVRSKGTHAYSRVYHPLRDVDTVEDLKKFSYPVMQEEELAYLAKEAKRLYTTTDKAICGVFNGNILELGQLYWGYEEFFVNLLSEPELMDYYFETRFEVMMQDLKKYLEAVGAYIQVIEFTEDLGTQQSLLISPEVYRARIKPCHAKMFGYIKQNYPEVKILFHSCGAIFDLIEDFIEIGADALNPVQITAAGMNPEALVEKFGGRIVFWGGGVGTQQTLCSETPDNVRQEVLENLDIFAKTGAYIFTQVHNVESSVPAENLLEAFLTAKKYRSDNGL